MIVLVFLWQSVGWPQGHMKVRLGLLWGRVAVFLATPGIFWRLRDNNGHDHDEGDLEQLLLLNKTLHFIPREAIL